MDKWYNLLLKALETLFANGPVVIVLTLVIGVAGWAYLDQKQEFAAFRLKAENQLAVLSKDMQQCMIDREKQAFTIGGLQIRVELLEAQKSQRPRR